MLYLYIGTDREKTRAAMNAAVENVAKKGARVARVNDASTPEDVRAALSERGMFETGASVAVLDGVFADVELKALVLQLLPALSKNEDHIFLLEEKLDAATKKTIEKHAKEVKKFDALKGERDDNFFAIVNALQRGQKKELWVLLQREMLAGKAPEMFHGGLFWAAKQLILKPRAASDAVRGKTLVARLAALPHEARHRGEDLEYALERFVLSGACPAPKSANS